WSSDVCSSDLPDLLPRVLVAGDAAAHGEVVRHRLAHAHGQEGRDVDALAGPGVVELDAGALHRVDLDDVRSEPLLGRPAGAPQEQGGEGLLLRRRGPTADVQGHAPRISRDALPA